MIALAYAVAAAGISVALPQIFPQVNSVAGLIVGGVILIGCAIMHEIFARQEAQGAMAEEVHDLRLAQGEVMRELTRARQETMLIKEAVESAFANRGKGLEKDVDNVVAEVRVLQNLVAKLSEDVAAPRDLSTKSAPEFATDFVESDRPSFGGMGFGTGPDDAADGFQPRNVAPVARDLNDAAILHIIQDGLRRDRVDLVFQPIVSLPQRKRKYFEAFSRIRAADGSIIVPEQYITIAEREGLITAIDNMLLFRCVQLLRKKQIRSNNIGFFCNISPYSLGDREFFGEFVEFMSENTELAPNLIFEFSQATIANGDDHMRRQLEHLARLGFRFSMDQVASLNLNYESLGRHHFKFVKIEAAALLRELERPTSDLFVPDFKKTLERFGIDLIVEKIESEPMLRDLLDFHIDFGQGYLFGEPKLSKAG